MKFIQANDLYFLAVIALIKMVDWSSSLRLKDYVVRGIVFTAYQLSRNKRRLSQANLSQTLSERLSERQQRDIVKGAFREFWEDVFSLSLSRQEKAALKGVEISGVEHLQNALRERKGAILWESSSFGKRHLAKHILHENGVALYQVHAERHLGGFRSGNGAATWVRHYIAKPFFERREKQFVTEIIYLPDSDSLVFTRRLLALLRQNAILCITGDVEFGRKLISQPFLGHTKLFATGMVSLAKTSGASILPMFCVQEPGSKTRLIIERPIRIDTGVEREQGLENSIAEYVGLLESRIRRYPEQYRSWHYIDRFPGHSGSALEV